MARREFPHFDHHLREIEYTRKRFRLTIAGLFILASAVLGSQYMGSEAATVPVVESGVAGMCLDDKNNSTANYNPVVIEPCNGSPEQQFTRSGTFVIIHGNMCVDPHFGGTTNGTLVQIFTCNTQVDKNWTFPNNTMVNTKANKCLDDPGSTRVGGTQQQIYTCNGTSAQKWTFTTFTLPTPPPTPRPTPTPTPPSTNPPPPPPPTNTPNPGGGDGGGVGGGGGTGGSDVPNAPQGFSATVSANGVVLLNWSASIDIAGIASYEVDRSVDQNNWSDLSDTISSTTYTDSTAAYGVSYYYRVKAVDNSGVSSDYSTATATTPAFNGSASTGNASTFTSDDQLASVTIPSGAMDSDADCSVSIDTNSHPASGSRRLVLGPYAVICKSSDGTQITAFSQPLAWTLTIKNKLKGLKNPTAWTVDGNGAITLVTNSKYDAKSGLVSFSTTTPNSVLVLADVVLGIPWNLVAIIFLLIAIVGGVFVLILRRQQKANYDDYLRQKYYNL